MQKKIGLIFTKSPRHSISMKNVEQRFLNGLSQTFKEVEMRKFILDINSNISKEGIIVGIKEFLPDYLVFVSPNPDYASYVDLFVLGLNHDVKYCFLIYADFALNPKGWKRFFEITQYEECLFLAASKAHARFVNQFLIEKNCKEIFYPVDTEVFHYDGRESKSNQKDSFKLVYAGRITYQKNVHLLIEIVNFINGMGLGNVELSIIGDFDDSSAEILGTKIHQHRYKDIFFSLVDNSRGKVSFLGPLSGKEISDIYQNMDGQISLSLHHHEEFGLAIAEGRCCGLKTFVSEWGGHLDIINEIHVESIKPDVKDGFFYLKKTKLVDSLVHFVNSKLDNTERERVARLCVDKYSKNNFFVILVKRLLEHNFCLTKTNTLFAEFCDTFTPLNRHPFVEISNGVKVTRSIYRKIYENFSSSNAGEN